MITTTRTNLVILLTDLTSTHASFFSVLEVAPWSCCLASALVTACSRFSSVVIYGMLYIVFLFEENLYNNINN